MTSNDIIFCTNETCSKRTVCRRGQKPTFTFASFCPFEPQCDTVERFRCDHFWPVNGEICNVCGHSLFLHAEYDYTGDTIRCCDCTVDGGFALAARWMGWETVAFVEREPFCQKVLRKNFREDIETHDDITTFTTDNLVNACYNKLNANQRKELHMAAHRKDYDEAVRMYDNGLSIGDIAKFYNITRQAMWAILKRRGCKFRSQRLK